MNQKPQASSPPPSGAGLFASLGAFCARYPRGVGAAVAILYFAAFMFWPHGDDPNDWHYRDFGRLPVIDGGRCKPLDTAARMNLMVLTHRQQFYNPETKTTMPATKWYLDSTTVPVPGNKMLNQLFANNGGEAWNYKIFRIENDQVLKMLDLKMREGLRYSLLEIAPNYNKVQDEVTRLSGDEHNIEAVDPKNYTLVEAKIMELATHIRLYMNMSGHVAPLVIPNADGSDQWKSFVAYMDEAMNNGGQIGNGIDAETFKTYLQLLALYGQKGEERKFNEILTKHLAELQKTQPARMRAIDTEIFFNEFAPFYRCLEIYAMIALFTALSWLTTSWGPTMRQAAFAAMVVTFGFHLGGLLLRMYLQDRYFVWVTNLYSSAVFIGCGCVAMCLIIEAIFKNGIPTVVGSVLGFLTLIIAHLLSLDGDTMIMMQAVLDTNFWLATHVTCVTLGYTTVFVAGFMGIAYILLGIFTGGLRGEGGANLTRMTYGVLCTGMFLSFVGTVLGGLWADYSWGRFWGWDPKENGALLIVIWVALILHARWGGMIKQRGIAVLSVIGIIVTTWSWFGTNFLGVGLHAYGGAKGSAMLGMVLIDFFFLGIAALGLLPLEHWQSFRPPSKAAAPLPPAPATGIKPAGA
jgi:ABC-type transport system involved in cytochrome c biogenesis permease subunit